MEGEDDAAATAWGGEDREERPIFVSRGGVGESRRGPELIPTSQRSVAILHLLFAFFFCVCVFLCAICLSLCFVVFEAEKDLSVFVCSQRSA